MDFDHFTSVFSKIEKLPLPGKHAQLSMTSKLRAIQMATENFSHKSPRKAAVLALCYPNKLFKTQLLFIKRKAIEGDVHSAQIGFPGGSVEAEDHSLMHTAIREAEEEVGISRDGIEHMIELSELYIPPSNFLVHPFFAFSKQQPEFSIQEEEVDSILEIPLTYFLDDMNISALKISNSYITDVEFPAFKYEDEVIWGATAMMLGEIRMLIKQFI